MEGFNQGLDRISREADVATDLIDTTADVSAEALQRAGHVLDQCMKFFGIATSAHKLVDEMVKRKLIDSKTLKWFSDIPLAKSLRMLMVVTATFSTGAANANNLAKSLSTAHGIYMTTLKQKAVEHQKFERTQAPQEKLQEFLNAIQGPAEHLRPKFEHTGDPVKDQAWRIAIASVFTPHENRISAEELDKNPEYAPMVQKIVGVPVGMDDMFENGTPEYKLDYSRFKDQLFAIYSDPEFARLQHAVQDSRLFFYWEVLDRANTDQPDYEEYRENNKALVEEAINYLKKNQNIQALAKFMNPQEFGIREDQRGKRVPLDIPDTLRS